MLKSNGGGGVRCGHRPFLLVLGGVMRKASTYASRPILAYFHCAKEFGVIPPAVLPRAIENGYNSYKGACGTRIDLFKAPRKETHH